MTPHTMFAARTAFIVLQAAERLNFDDVADSSDQNRVLLLLLVTVTALNTATGNSSSSIIVLIYIIV